MFLSLTPGTGALTIIVITTGLTPRDSALALSLLPISMSASSSWIMWLSELETSLFVSTVGSGGMCPDLVKVS